MKIIKQMYLVNIRNRVKALVIFSKKSVKKDFLKYLKNVFRILLPPEL